MLGYASGSSKWALPQYRNVSHPPCIGKDPVIPNMWGHFICDERATAGAIVSHLTTQVCSNLTSLPLITDKNESKSADYTKSSFSAGAAYSLACMHQIINQWMLPITQETAHSYLAFSFWPISTVETGLGKEALGVRGNNKGNGG